MNGRGGMIVEAERFGVLNLGDDTPVTVRPAECGWYIDADGEWEADIVGMDDAFACRVASADVVHDVVQLGIGRVSSRLCNAVFSPRLDRAVVFEGNAAWVKDGGSTLRVHSDGPMRIRVMDGYFKLFQKFPWFASMDRSRLTRAPAGWCSWYYYYEDINDREVALNAEWLAEHLKPFGLEYLQIDDGWQRPNGSLDRDWTHADPGKFPDGMKATADQIRSLGLKPGIWATPFWQSSEEVYRRQPAAFMHWPDGEPVCMEAAAEHPVLRPPWAPKDMRHFLVDPTSAEGGEYLRGLLQRLAGEWGYDYLKFDDQWCAWLAYIQFWRCAASRREHGDRIYEKGVRAIRECTDPRVFILNCAGGCPAAGIWNGLRIGGDVKAEWHGVLEAARATTRHQRLNTLAFYTDPDVVCVREPLTLEQARAWAVLVGMTGQAMMFSDRMVDLPEERVELLRRVLPVADIHPMELYTLHRDPAPPIFNVKVNLPGIGQWDVVAVFNWSETQGQTVDLSAARLGLEPGDYYWFDSAAGSLLNAAAGVVKVEVPTTACRVVSVWRKASHPVFLGTSRHLTQGAVDVESVAWDADGGFLRGVSRVVPGDTYRVRAGVPAGWRVRTPDVDVLGELAELTLPASAGGRTEWEIAFCEV